MALLIRKLINKTILNEVGFNHWLFIFNIARCKKKLCGLGKRISLQLVFKHAVYDGVEGIVEVLSNAVLRPRGDE